ncbi:Uncharacterised protein [Mycobacterium tuberculosis]|nr:Uncharacterised protein [Mycobacterium tuberculosis]COW78050.1 Uncharacterised protein [Mycobacterium tuberculosis]COY25486.1 Uncharacterised protein [Mycobacterium tuberculosis]
MSVVWFVNPHHLLHDRRRQPDLMTHHAGTLGHPLPDVDQLDLVGVDDIDLGMGGGQLTDRVAASLGLY